MEAGKFAELEAKVARLIEEHAALKSERLKLEDAVHQKELEIRGLKEKLLELRRDREEARGRIDRVLGHLARLDLKA